MAGVNGKSGYARLIVIGGCLGCGLCREYCPFGAIEQGRPGVSIGVGCRQCASCLEVCPAGAIVFCSDDAKVPEG
ncbi:MAG: 4Fe-4S binding protein [Candidatus Adiutrix sp.]|nr:4Fe-4S binding protein [Candidatus Adiutrix sp.]